MMASPSPLLGIDKDSSVHSNTRIRNSDNMRLCASWGTFGKHLIILHPEWWADAALSVLNPGRLEWIIPISPTLTSHHFTASYLTAPKRMLYLSANLLRRHWSSSLTRRFAMCGGQIFLCVGPVSAPHRTALHYSIILLPMRWGLTCITWVTERRVRDP